MAHIQVIGCGVIGLTTAVELQEAGHKVDITCRALPHNTVSAVAAAIWFPFSAEPKARVDAWSRSTFLTFARLAAEPHQTGVFMTDFLVYVEDASYVYWEDALPQGIKREAEPELIPGHYHTAYYLRVPFSDSSVYMPYLLKRFRQNGGQIQQREVTDLLAEAKHYDWVINCTGLGARELCDDPHLYPIRGQVLRVPKPDQPLRTFIDEYMPQRLAYVLERRNDVILGGTAVPHDYSMEEDGQMTQRIRELCEDKQPALREMPTLEVKTGLRPGRTAIRLEKQANHNIIHNYGHGGSGYTVSWGCAKEVLQIIEKNE